MINKLLIKLGLRKPPEPDLPTLRVHDWDELEAERLRIRQRVHSPVGGRPVLLQPGERVRFAHTPPRPLPAPAPTHHYVRSPEPFVPVDSAPPRRYSETPDDSLRALASFVAMPAPAPEEPFRSGGGGDFGGGGATGSWGDDSPSPSPSPSTD